MPRGAITWKQKLAQLAGTPTRGAAKRIAAALKPHYRGRGLSERNVRYWLAGKTESENLGELLAAIAAAYADRGVTVEWLLDGEDSPLPVIGRQASAALVREFLVAAERAGISKAAREVILATTDDDACSYLHQQLGVYRSSIGPKARSGARGS